MIRTRMQGDTPFFPNMLNNGKVEVCLKEDVDKALAEKDEEIAALRHAINMADAEYSKLQRCRDEFERHFDRQLETSALQQMINMADSKCFQLRQSADGCQQEIEGCHYCKDGEPLWKSNLESVVIGKNPQTRNPSIKLGHSLSIPIEYCPKCGRKL